MAIACIIVVLFLALVSPAQIVGTSEPLAPSSSRFNPDDQPAIDASSTYVELDSWVYPALERLGAQGVIQHEFLGLRPWTRRDIYQMLEHATQGTDASEELVQAVKKELFRDVALGSDPLDKDIFIESVYSRTQFISGTPLNDSYHFGQTLADDFGRPYGHGLQQIAGLEARAEHGRFSLFVRGEYQHSPSVPGYSAAIAGIIAIQDTNPIRTYSNQPAGDAFRLLDTYASVELVGQQFSFGKQSYWWGPGSASAMMLSDNAEPFYSFRINRTLPLYIPLLSRLLGPVRYDNFFGKLSGHMYPRQPYFYGQKINFSPTKNLELGFSRDAVIAGDGSTPLTFGNFWKQLHQHVQRHNGRLTPQRGWRPPCQFRLSVSPARPPELVNLIYRLPGPRRRFARGRTTKSCHHFRHLPNEVPADIQARSAGRGWQHRHHCKS